MNVKGEMGLATDEGVMRRSFAFVVIFIAMSMSSSCSRSQFDGGPERNIVVLSSRPVGLGERPLVFTPSEITKVSGALSSVCFVVRDNLPMQDMKSMEKEFGEAMDGVEIDTTVRLSSGNSVALSKPHISWSEDGVILKHGELAACSSPRCGVTLPLGARVNSIEVTAVPDFVVKGIYWQSEKDPSESFAPSAGPQSNSKSAAASDCTRS